MAKVIYTKTIRLKNGRVLHANEVGKNVFRFEVDEDKQKPRRKGGK